MQERKRDGGTTEGSGNRAGGGANKAQQWQLVGRIRSGVVPLLQEVEMEQEQDPRVMGIKIPGPVRLIMRGK